MKRLFVLLAALAALSTVIAASALAGGGNAVPTCNAANNYTVNGSSSNLDIPAGTFCYLVGEFQGNVTVEGYASPAGATFDKNVIVSGGTISTVNHGADIKGNLNISGSHGDPVAGLANILKAEYNDVTIEGNLNYTGNFVPLIIQGPYNVNVKGTFNYSGNTTPWAGSPTFFAGKSSIS